MNDLIKQKALESGLIYPVPPATDEPLPHYVNAINKFTALIIQECLNECWYDATPKQISDNIKMKFGVE